MAFCLKERETDSYVKLDNQFAWETLCSAFDKISNVEPYPSPYWSSNLAARKIILNLRTALTNERFPSVEDVIPTPTPFQGVSFDN